MDGKLDCRIVAAGRLLPAKRRGQRVNLHTDQDPNPLKNPEKWSVRPARLDSRLIAAI